MFRVVTSKNNTGPGCDVTKSDATGPAGHPFSLIFLVRGYSRMAYRILKSSKGKDMVEFESFLYNFEKDLPSGNGRTFKCSEYHKIRCRARCTLENGNLVTSAVEHNHEADRKKVVNLECRSHLKRAIQEDPVRPLKRVYNTVINEQVNELQNNDVDEIDVGGLPGFNTVRYTMRRTKAKLIPKQPRRAEELILEGEWTLSNNRSQFLLVNDPLPKRILIFGTMAFLGLLCAAPMAFMDGTFRSCPSIFSQLYTIHGLHLGQMIPFLYALLPDKSKETYVRMFRLIEGIAAQNRREFRPRHFFSDFEVAVFQAIATVFPGSEVHGCLFHYAQSIWRKVQRVGLQAHYGLGHFVKRTIKRILALPLLPLEAISEAWLLIHNDAPIEIPGMVEFLNYVVENWVDELEARFPRQIWNHYRNFNVRTNNHIEGWHLALNKSFPNAHPKIYDFVQEIKRHQSNFENCIILLNAGGEPPMPNKKYSKINEKIIQLTNQYDNPPPQQEQRGLLSFLDAAGHQLPLQDM